MGQAVLAPAWWRCSALVDADGGQVVEVTVPSAAVSNQLIASYSNGGACQSCAYNVACHYFTVPNPDGYSCNPAPAGERVQRVDAMSVLVFDPPGSTPLAGAPPPGNDPLPVANVVVFSQRDGAIWVWTASCVLPSDETGYAEYLLEQYGHWAEQQAGDAA